MSSSPDCFEWAFEEGHTLPRTLEPEPKAPAAPAGTSRVPKHRHECQLEVAGRTQHSHIPKQDLQILSYPAVEDVDCPDKAKHLEDV